MRFVYLQQHCRLPDQLYECVLEVDEAVVLPLGAEPDARNGKDAASNARCVWDGCGCEGGSCAAGTEPRTAWMPMDKGSSTSTLLLGWPWDLMLLPSGATGPAMQSDCCTCFMHDG